MTDIAVRDEPFGITCALFFRSSALFMLILVATFLPVCLSYLAGEIHHYWELCIFVLLAIILGSTRKSLCYRPYTLIYLCPWNGFIRISLLTSSMLE